MKKKIIGRKSEEYGEAMQQQRQKNIEEYICKELRFSKNSNVIT